MTENPYSPSIICVDRGIGHHCWNEGYNQANEDADDMLEKCAQKAAEGMPVTYEAMRILLKALRKKVD